MQPFTATPDGRPARRFQKAGFALRLAALAVCAGLLFGPFAVSEAEASVRTGTVWVTVPTAASQTYKFASYPTAPTASRGYWVIPPRTPWTAPPSWVTVAPKPAPTPVPTPKPTPVPAPIVSQDLETQMLALVNAERAKVGLAALKTDPELTRLARMKSADMVALKYFSHTSPTYGSPFDMMRAAGVAYRIAGENLAGATNLALAFDGLMQSPGHRANILRPEFTHIGIGVVKGGQYGYIFTQMFIGR